MLFRSVTYTKVLWSVEGSKRRLEKSTASNQDEQEEEVIELLPLPLLGDVPTLAVPSPTAALLEDIAVDLPVMHLAPTDFVDVTASSLFAHAGGGDDELDFVRALGNAQTAVGLSADSEQVPRENPFAKDWRL